MKSEECLLLADLAVLFEQCNSHFNSNLEALGSIHKNKNLSFSAMFSPFLTTYSCLYDFTTDIKIILYYQPFWW